MKILKHAAKNYGHELVYDRSVGVYKLVRLNQPDRYFSRHELKSMPLYVFVQKYLSV